jgi:cysteinyl-tRNA synthetase
MALRIYDTQRRRAEPLETLEPGRVRIYVCGVTVYDRAHIGHAMSAVVFDVVRRYLEWQGYAVRHVVNYTDVDDKIIARAQELAVDPRGLAEGLIAEFEEDLRALSVLPATVYPRATDTIPEIVAFIERLIATGHAYAAEGDVYFRVASDPDYGQLSGRALDEMIAGTRFEVDPRKEAAADFALWKAAKPGEPAWPSPWGEGRPGWHIECSAMNLAHLGEQIDIHGGGTDLIFPHHENEIAQSESLTGKPFVRYWMHNGMLQLVTAKTRQIEKMSKSLGNVVTIRDFLARHSADVFRLLVVGSHYRSPLTYNEEIAADTARKLERLLGGLLPPVGSAESGPAAEALASETAAALDRFTTAMDDDFGTAGALAAVFDLVRAINVARDAGVGGRPFAAAQDRLRQLTGVFGLTLQQRRASAGAEPFIELLISVRADLRKARQFALADQVRDRLAALGVVLEDGPQGTRWRFE